MNDTTPVPDDFSRELERSGVIIPVGVPGAFGRGAVFEEVVRGFDELVTRTTSHETAEHMMFPPIIDRRLFERSGFLDHGTAFLLGELQHRVHGTRRPSGQVTRFHAGCHA